MKAYFYSDNKQKAIDFFDQTAKVEKKHFCIIVLLDIVQGKLFEN
jgi:hypothetical protein